MMQFDDPKVEVLSGYALDELALFLAEHQGES
jgi:hypothetical protein